MGQYYDPALHHRRSVRLKGYDYSSPGLYFVTLCMEKRQCLLGHILAEGDEDLPSVSERDAYVPRVILTPLGRMVEEEWRALPLKYPRLQLREFVIMPNHLHAILELLPEELSPNPDGVQSLVANEKRLLSLGNVLAYFKYQTAKRSSMSSRLWQRSFYDVIIRDPSAYRAVVNYISENPRRWGLDELHP